MRRQKNKHEVALELAREITQVEAKIAPLQAHLTSLRRQFALLIPEDAPPSKPPEPASQKAAGTVNGSLFSAPDDDGTIGDRIERFLTDYNREADADVIARGVNMTDKRQMPTIRNTIGRLVKSGRILHVSRGIYAPKSAQKGQGQSP